MPPYAKPAAPSKEELTEIMNAALSQYLEPVSQKVLDNGGTFSFTFTIDSIEQTDRGFSLSNLNLSINADW